MTPPASGTESARPRLFAVLARLGNAAPADALQALEEVVAAMRAHLGMEVAFIAEFADGRRWLRHVDAGDDAPPRVGTSALLEQTYCQRMVDGRLSRVIPDVAAEAGARDLDPGSALPTGSCIGVPLRFSDGRVYGTLCAMDAAPRPDLSGRDVAVLEMVADFVADALERDVVQRARTAAQRARVRRAIDDDGLRTLLQPIVVLRTGQVAGHEALTRFTVDDRPPDVWFREAAESGLGVELELAAARTALGRMHERPPGTYLAVKLSAGALLAPGTIEALRAHPLDGVVVELTGRAAEEEYLLLAGATGTLQAAGARIAVSETGAGYTGFDHILQLHPDILKLDMGLVSFVSRDIGRQALIEAFVHFAGRCGLHLVAEGVEFADDAASLLELGVGYAQGYNFGRPAPRFTARPVDTDWSALTPMP